MLLVHGETTLVGFSLLGLMLLIVAALHASACWALVLVIFVNVGLELVGRPVILANTIVRIGLFGTFRTGQLPVRVL